ncbi:MAG TPA: hypothetical protein VFU31_29815 [Candidatus Binatia bacterium]|nr:hypothetical protein [Candidatus Binatia bacterium]
MSKQEAQIIGEHRHGTYFGEETLEYQALNLTDRLGVEIGVDGVGYFWACEGINSIDHGKRFTDQFYAAIDFLSTPLAREELTIRRQKDLQIIADCLEATK